MRIGEILPRATKDVTEKLQDFYIISYKHRENNILIVTTV